MADAGQTWDIGSILGTSHTGKERYAAILLNQPILSPQKDVVERIWNQATLKLCADGGANRLFDAFGESCVLPHEIRGDLDSLRSDVRQFFEAKNVSIVRAASQYATDLQKCILAVEEFEELHADDDRLIVVILGGMSGRLDQTMHTFHVLCQLAKTKSIPNARPAHTVQHKGLAEDEYVTLQRRSKTVAISENSIAWLLVKGTHTINVDLSLFGPTCGLLPFAAKVADESSTPSGTRIWTKGLRWNLDGEESAVGGFLSTSNHLQDKIVEVRTDKEIIWTMEIRETL